MSWVPTASSNPNMDSRSNKKNGGDTKHLNQQPNQSNIILARTSQKGGDTRILIFRKPQNEVSSNAYSENGQSPMP